MDAEWTRADKRHSEQSSALFAIAEAAGKTELDDQINWLVARLSSHWSNDPVSALRALRMEPGLCLELLGGAQQPMAEVIAAVPERAPAVGPVENVKRVAAPKRLLDIDARVLDLIAEHPKGILGKHIVKKIPAVTEQYLRNHIIKRLRARKHPVRNDRNGNGYYLDTQHDATS